MDWKFLINSDRYKFLRWPGFYVILGIVALLLIIYWNFYAIVRYLFPFGIETEKSAFLETLKFVAYLIGGVLLVWQIVLTNRRTKAAEDNLKILERGQIQQRFKDAIDQLGDDKQPVVLGAIYTLHHVAKDSETLRKSVFDILCSYIRETTSNEDYKKLEKPSIRIQSILNLLFVDEEERKMYKGFRADLNSSHLIGANLSGAYLYGANLSNANLSNANLSKANLSGARLSKANLSKANLSEANLSEANLSKANLSGAYLYGAYLSKANLSEAYLSEAYLYGANLSNANLSKANLSGARLSKANLFKANLSEAYLSGAYLSKANLSEAYLYGANVGNLDWIPRLSKWECTGVEEIAKKYKVISMEKEGKTVYRIMTKDTNDQPTDGRGTITESEKQ